MIRQAVAFPGFLQGVKQKILTKVQARGLSLESPCWVKR